MAEDNDDLHWIEKFEDFCSSDDLSIDGIMRRITDGVSFFSSNGISLASKLSDSSFFHRVCMNKNVTLEIVNYLLDLFPSAIYRCLAIPDVVSAYPLHLACCNKECPNEVIQLLLTRNHNYQLQYMCYMEFDWGNTNIEEGDYFGGTPLHYYLSRTSNVDLNIVKELAADPLVLLSVDDDTKCTPIHILMHNKSIGDLSDVVTYLVESSPSSLKVQDEYDQNPLNAACSNGFMTVKTIELLLRVCPDSIYEPSNWGGLPIHTLCEARIDDEVATDILKLLLEAHPNSVSDQNNDDGELPLHLAANNKSPAFCKLLVDAYPESVRRGGSGANGSLPIHSACYGGRPDTLEYLLKVYPESLYTRNDGSYLPIHCAASSTEQKNAVDIIKFFLRHDPECLSRQIVSDYRGDDYRQGNGALPLHLSCNNMYQSEDMSRLLFDLYPEAILVRNERGQLPIDVVRNRDEGLHTNPQTGRPYHMDQRRRNKSLMHFLSVQIKYATKSQDGIGLRTPDSSGLLPLHSALRALAPLGSIKLLVKGNPDAINVPDDNGMCPLDIASQSSPLGVVKYLADVVPGRLNSCDENKNYPLHRACRGGNCEVISYLLERPVSSASVLERNSDDMLPIHLFCKFVNELEGKEDTPSYTETIWRLLTAYPETVLNW